jgi:hypothetical protein
MKEQIMVKNVHQVLIVVATLTLEHTTFVYLEAWFDATQRHLLTILVLSAEME